MPAAAGGLNVELAAIVSPCGGPRQHTDLISKTNTAKEGKNVPVMEFIHETDGALHSIKVTHHLIQDL